MNDYAMIDNIIGALFLTIVRGGLSEEQEAELRKTLDRVEDVASDLKTGYTVTLGGKR